MITSPTFSESLIRLSENEVIDIWNALLDADMQARHWKRQLHKGQRLDLWMKVTVAVTSSSTVATWTLWSSIPWLWKCLSAITAVASIIHPLLGISSQVDEMTNVYGEWVRLHNDYEDLFRQLPDMNRKQSLAEYTQIRRDEVRLEQRSAKLPTCQKLYDNCYDEVCGSRGILNLRNKKEIKNG